jgi:hypothetical protein
MITPLEAIHKFCVTCVGSPFEVKDCGGDACLNGGRDKNGVCWFYKYRLGKGRPSVKLIRKMCLWCQGDSKELVRECVEDGKHTGLPACALWPYRMGINPKRAEIGGKPPVTAHVSRGFAA